MGLTVVPVTGDLPKVVLFRILLYGDGGGTVLAETMTSKYGFQVDYFSLFGSIAQGTEYEPNLRQTSFSCRYA